MTTFMRNLGVHVHIARVTSLVDLTAEWGGRIFPKKSSLE